jgi:hypothetical protein
MESVVDCMESLELLVEKVGKPRKISVRIAGLRTEIRIRDRRNTEVLTALNRGVRRTRLGFKGLRVRSRLLRLIRK